MREYSPRNLYEILKHSVIGQDHYLKKIATTMWLHHKRIEAQRYIFGNQKLQKFNLLCVGPTGSGKTLAASILADLYGMDMIIEDMSGYTGAGYKGRDVEEIFKNLYLACNKDKERTERGIVIMDEIDKMLLAKGQGDQSFCAENALLKILEGTHVRINLNDNSKITINTSNILFIASGAFEGIEDIVRRRKGCKYVGFATTSEASLDDAEVYALIEKEDLRRYGVGSQFLGRFANIATLNKLDVPTLTSILLNSKASVIRSLDMTLKLSCGIRVSIDEAGANAVADQAAKEGTGARGLSQIILPLLDDTLFAISDDQNVNEIQVTADEAGNPTVWLIEGPRLEKKPIARPAIRCSWPHADKHNVEGLCWRLLEPYLDENKLRYKDIQAMHALACSIVFYLDSECNAYECIMDSIKKLAGCAREESGDGDETVYEIMIEKESRKHFPRDPAYMQYYKTFRRLDPSYHTVPQLLKALARFKETGKLSGKKEKKET